MQWSCFVPKHGLPTPWPSDSKADSSGAKSPWNILSHGPIHRKNDAGKPTFRIPWKVSSGNLLIYLLLNYIEICSLSTAISCSLHLLLVASCSSCTIPNGPSSDAILPKLVSFVKLRVFTLEFTLYIIVYCGKFQNGNICINMLYIPVNVRRACISDHQDFHVIQDSSWPFLSIH